MELDILLSFLDRVGLATVFRRQELFALFLTIGHAAGVKLYSQDRQDLSRHISNSRE